MRPELSLSLWELSLRMMRVRLINPYYRHNISYQLMQFSSEVKVKPLLPAQQPSNFGPASCFGEQETMWE